MTLAKRVRESSIEKYLVDEVKRKGGKTCKVAGGEGGSPDRLVKMPDLPAMLIEVKKPGTDGPTPLQLERIRQWRAVGMKAGWVGTKSEVDLILGPGRPKL
jgi:hypothetical protein